VKKIEAVVDGVANGVGTFYILIFAATYLLKYAMQLFWASIRNLKNIFNLSLIRFPMTPIMKIFMSRMSQFA
jgi:hypothetical protein